MDPAKAGPLLKRALDALDVLLATVPEDVLEKGRQVLEVARSTPLEALEPELGGAAGKALGQ